MNPRPILPWRSGLILAAAVAIAVPIAALWLSADDDGDATLVLAPSSLAPIESGLDDAMRSAGIGPIEWVFAGSQSLVAQIGDGVPADVVLVADIVARDAVASADPTFDAGTVFASNSLVLALAPGNPAQITSVADLGEPDHLIGLCAIEVPCGRLAAATLVELGVTPAVDTEETSVRALTTKIASGELDGGLIYRTDARAADLEVVGDDRLQRFTNDYFAMSTDEGRAIADVLLGDDIAALLASAGFDA